MRPAGLPNLRTRLLPSSGRPPSRPSRPAPPENGGSASWVAETWGRWHFDSYRQNPGVQVVAFADTNLESAERLAREAGATAYASHTAMLEQEKLDGVSICTIPSTHRQIALDFLRAGVDVLCEKPLTISAADANEMYDAAEQADRHLIPAFKFRFAEEVVAARQLIERGVLGKISSFRLMFGGFAEMAGRWFAEKDRAGGGVIMDNGPHAVDLVRHLFGEIEYVSAATANAQTLAVEDTAKIQCRLSDGIVGTVDLSWSVPVPSKTYLEIYADGGTCLLDLDGLTYRLATWSEWKRLANRGTVQDAFRRQIDHFVGVLGDAEPSVVRNEDGPKSQAVIEAAYESLKRGKRHRSIRSPPRAGRSMKPLRIFDRRRGGGEPAFSAGMRRAIDWVAANRAPGGGIRVNSKSDIASREVTGYLVDSLFRAGEKSLAFELARWEAAGQKPDGSVAAPDGVPYTFDTAQVIRGFLAVVDELPEIEPHLRRACDWVAGQIQADGYVASPSLEMWSLPDGTRFTEYANLYVLPPLRAAGERLGENRYLEAASRGMEFFRRQPDLVEFKSELGTLSHIFGYMMEALVELDEIDLARKGLAQAASIQKADGSIPAFPGAGWICSTGIAQLAIAWYRLGDTVPADRAVAFLERLQHRSGGFFGSYGPGAVYLPAAEISWGVKFFMDALLLREEARAAAADAAQSAAKNS